MVWSRNYGVFELPDIVRQDVPSAGSILRMRRLLMKQYPPENSKPRLRKQAEMEVFLKGEKK